MTARTPLSSARHRNRAGQTLPLIALTIATVLAAAAFAIDVGMLYSVRAELQRTADASALAAAQELPSQANAAVVAMQYAATNEPEHGTVVAAEDVTVGNWTTGTFTPGGEPINAVRVHAWRVADRGNAPGLFFAKTFGFIEADVGTRAIATSGSEGGEDSRFLVDEDLIDTDIPVIEQLAASLGKTPEQIISDGNGDWFIDLPPGSILELPTGQVGDEGLFEIEGPSFPFAAGPTGVGPPYTFSDFLNYNEDSGSWRYQLLEKEMLDPLIGVDTVDDPAEYPDFVTPPGAGCQVSPIYKSDVNSPPTPVNEPPRVKALGLRRGLLAFKVLSIGSDPDGPSGSKLPNIVILVCDPSDYIGDGGLDNFGPGGDLRIRLVK
jgi:hypothetical protein